MSQETEDTAPLTQNKNVKKDNVNKVIVNYLKEHNFNSNYTEIFNEIKKQFPNLPDQEIANYIQSYFTPPQLPYDILTQISRNDPRHPNYFNTKSSSQTPSSSQNSEGGKRRKTKKSKKLKRKTKKK